MLLSIIKNEKLKIKREEEKEIKRIIIMYKNLNLLNYENKNYISIIILLMLMRYKKILLKKNTLNKYLLYSKNKNI
jgi:hypothetical protein